MNAQFLYGMNMSEDAQTEFDALWNEYSSSRMGALRRALSADLGRQAPPAPTYTENVSEWHERLVRYCDKIVLAKSLAGRNDGDSVLTI